MPSEEKCKYCLRTRCYAHCALSKDGKHVADPRSAHLGDATNNEVVIDFNCKHCGISSGVAIPLKRLEEIEWE
jgi:hypothetical protein